MPILSRILAVLLLCAGLFCLGQQAFAGPSNDPNFVNGVVKKSCASQQCLAQTMLLLGAGKGAPGGGGTPFGISFIGSNSSTAGTSSYTFTAQGIGAADSTRTVGVCVASAINSVNITALTVQGISGTQATGAAKNSTAGSLSDIWDAPVPTGTTGDVVVTFSGAQSRAAIFVYRLIGTGLAFSAANGALSSPTVNTLSASVTVPAGGGVFGCTSVHIATAGTFSGTNLTEDVTAGLVFGGSTGSSGHDASHSGSTSFGFSWGGTAGDAAMSVAAFSP